MLFNLDWLNRDLQKSLLLLCAETPERFVNLQEMTDSYIGFIGQNGFYLSPEFEYLNQIAKPWGVSSHQHIQQIIKKNLHYLSGHNLGEIHLLPGGTAFKITSRGIDFLRDDGGLAAILGVKTVKIHADTLSELKALLADKLDQSGLPEAEKAKLQEKLAEYGDVGIKHLITKLLDVGVQNLPKLISTLGIPGLFN